MCISAGEISSVQGKCAVHLQDVPLCLHDVELQCLDLFAVAYCGVGQQCRPEAHLISTMSELLSPVWKSLEFARLHQMKRREATNIWQSKYSFEEAGAIVAGSQGLTLHVAMENPWLGCGGGE